MEGAWRTFVAVNEAEFAATFTPETFAALEAFGPVEFGADRAQVAVPTDVAERFDVLLTSWCTAPFSPETVNGPRLRLAAHLGASVRAWFPPEALGRRLRVVQCGADAMALPVAEMALTLALSLLRNVQLHDRRLQASRDWTVGGNGMLGRSIHGLRHGIIGLSRTGRHYLRMLQGLGVSDIVAYDPYASAAEMSGNGVQLVGLDELFSNCDVVAVHAPATPETHRMIGADQLRALPDGAVFVNTARSALVDQHALLRELGSERISAGLDVFDDEPLPSDSPFFGLPNAILTPHVAGGTSTARAQQGLTAVSEISRFRSGEPLQHEVTRQNYDRLA